MPENPRLYSAEGSEEKVQNGMTLMWKSLMLVAEGYQDFSLQTWPEF